MTWQREFTVTAPPGRLATAGILLGLFGLGLLIWAPVSGVVVTLLGWGLWFAAHALRARQIVRCGPAGFTVIRRRAFAAAREATVAWGEVREIRYVRTGDDAGFIHVTTAAGSVFEISHRTQEFADLIAVFGATCSHLPYVWRKVPGGYRAVDRAAQQSEGWQ